MKKLFFILILVNIIFCCYIPAAHCITFEASSINAEFIQAQIKEVEANTALEKEARDSTLSTLNSALELFRQSAEWETKLQAQDKLILSAPEQVKSLKVSLEIPMTPEAEMRIPRDSKEKLELMLIKCQADLAQNSKTVVEMDTLLKQISERRTSLPQLISERKKKKDDTSAELGSTTSTGAGIGYGKLLLNVRMKSLEKEIATSEKELLTLDLRQELAKLKKEKAGRENLFLEKKIRLVTDRINEIRKNEAVEAKKNAEEEIRKSAFSHPEVVKLAKENAALAALRTGDDGLINRIELIQKKIEDSKKTLKKLNEEYEGIRLKVKASGLTHAIGMLLRVRKNDLPNLAQVNKILKENREEISSIQIQLLEFEEKREELIQVDVIATEILKDIDKSIPEYKRTLIENNVRELLIKKKDFIDANIKDSNTWFSRLVDYDTIQRELYDHVVVYRNYIDERVLWIKSMSPFWTKQFRNLYSGLTWLFKMRSWKRFFSSLISGVIKNPVISLSLFVLVVLILYLRRIMKERYLQISAMVKSASSDRLSYTFESFLDLFMISAAWPSILICIAYFASADSPDSFSNAVIDALYLVGYVWFIAEFLLHFYRKDGMAHNQFRWFPEDTHQNITGFLRKIEVFCLPVFFFMSIIFNASNETYVESIGRMLFVVMLIIAGALYHIYFKPNGVIFDSMQSYVLNKWVYKLRYPFYLFFMLFSALLIILSLIGYNYTAFQLFSKYLLTNIYFTCIAVFYSISNRLISLFKRTLAIRKYQEKANTPAGKDSQGVNSAEESVDIAAIGEQTRKILKVLVIILACVCIWLIWNDILPALKIFEQVKLWKTRIQVTDIITSPDGSTREALSESLVDITLFNLLTAILIISFTLFVNKNFSGLLEVLLLSHLPLDQGIRFAVKTITSYSITVIGFIAAFNTIGIGWSKVQWLIAAISVGLGFGLQEIFANLVSGLIILFERPMRIGDIVTIGDVTGSISKIKIRATTITNWDRKEIIIPNKEFITSRLMNWTLTDTVLRLVFKVGVAYGSDVEKVHQILLDIAKSCPEILEDPQPRAVFTGFGDSSLDFELRAFISDLSHLVALSDRVHSMIDAEFRKNSVEIPFPQRDLHVRSFLGNREVAKIDGVDVAPVKS